MDKNEAEQNSHSSSRRDVVVDVLAQGVLALMMKRASLRNLRDVEDEVVENEESSSSASSAVMDKPESLMSRWP